jgi:hypothetical protein
MKANHYDRIGAIFFFIGVILLLFSWHFSYPIYLTAPDELTFDQFHPSTWPGITLTLLGLFLTGYYSEKKSIKVICSAFIPITLYVYSFYFSYLLSADSGNVKSMFEIFHKVGIDSSVIPYFQYPTYFTLNEITNQILGIDSNSIAALFFALYGILLGAFLFLFLFKKTRDDQFQIAFLAIPLYFITIFFYINYQWVPQTFALVLFFLLLLTIDREGNQYKLFSFIIFIPFVFTHAFIPVIFLLFFGLYTYKKRSFFKFFILMCCIYVTVLIYYTTYYLPVIIDIFKETFNGFGGEYTSKIAISLKETTGIFDQIFSFINRIRIPLTFIVLSLGFVISFVKKKLDFLIIMLIIAGGFYLTIGLFFSILGLRALQIVVISLVLGIGFYAIKWRKQTLIFVIVLLLLSIAGPMRNSYNQTNFLLNEEENACRFLATTMPFGVQHNIALDQVDWGYFTNIDKYINGRSSLAIRPGTQEFYLIFHPFMKENNYVIYNSNLVKEIKNFGVMSDNNTIFSKTTALNNKLYQCGKTSILTGLQT